jgi:tripartite-type tricarboxylate transporter receptor subunit TctC
MPTRRQALSGATLSVAALSVAALSAPRLARAQAWPARPIRFIVPYGAGNQADQVARVLADALADRWGQRLVVENLAGAGGSIGVAAIARAVPDGYTIGLIAIAAMAVMPHMQKVGYDPLTDLMPLAGASISRDVLVVHPSLPARTLKDLVVHARARPAGDPLFYWSAGAGTIPHLNIETLRRALDFPATHVPYRTAAAGVADHLAGRIHFSVGGATVNLPPIQSGGLAPIFVNAPQRLPQLPDVPTLAESEPDIELVSAWQSVYAPRGVPPDIAARIARDVQAIVGSAAFAQRFPQGSDPLPLDAAEVGSRMRNDHARLGALVRELGLEAG